MQNLNFNELQSGQTQHAGNLVITDLHDGFATVEINGDDAISFLQGQLSADICALKTNHCTTAALCNPKGRVIANLEILRFEHKLLAIVRQDMTELVLSHLRKYVMRSKVSFENLDFARSLSANNCSDCFPNSGECAEQDGMLKFTPSWMIPKNRWHFSTQVPAIEATNLSWRQAHLMWAVAQINPHTTEQHIPQALRLDELNAISFTKGCYTGQEIIARVHHRGKVTRRLQRFIMSSNAEVNYGDSVKTETGSSAGEVVEFADDHQGNRAVLAVIKQSAQAATLNEIALNPWPIT